MTVVFITGASSGIGYATAKAFAAQGAQVAGTARREERLAQLAQEIESLPGAFLPITADVRDSAAMHAAVEQTIAHYGRIDVVIANAGLGQRGGLIDSEWDDLETLMRTNMDGVLHTIRAAVPPMREQHSGHIVFVSSVVYNMTSPYAAIYAASKAFVSSIANSLRLELEADNIHITDMRIGRTDSEFSAQRLGTAGYGESASSIPRMSSDDVAAAIVSATQTKRKTVALRWLDRLIMVANVLTPNLIGRRALKQYK